MWIAYKGSLEDIAPWPVLACHLRRFAFQLGEHLYVVPLFMVLLLS